MRAHSTPPRTPNWLGTQKPSGSFMPAMPRKTLAATVSLPNLMMAELTACSVVVYLRRTRFRKLSGAPSRIGL